jgi:hypothetical protein
MHRSCLVLTACVAAASASACSDEQNVQCAPLSPAAVAVIVRDSITANLLVDSARGLLMTPTQTDSLRRGPALQFGDSVLIGGSQVGVVTLRIERTGYQPWLKSDIQTRLAGSPCPTFVTQLVTARLQH